MKDPAFVQKLQAIQTNPAMMQMYLQDPQIQEAFSVMFGFDASGNMGANEAPQGWEDISPKQDTKMEEEKKPESPKKPAHKPEQKQTSDVSEAEELKN